MYFLMFIAQMSPRSIFLVLDYKDFDKQPRPSMSMTGFAMPGGECDFQTNQYGHFGGQGWQLFS